MKLVNPPPALPRQPESQVEHPALRKAAQQFEAVFVHQMVNAMRNTVPHEGFIPQSQAERIYRGMLDQEYAQKISDSGGLGLSELVYQHLLRTVPGR